jgi:uncharacterized protein (TIGR00159 family)
VWLNNQLWNQSLLIRILDIGLALGLIFLILLIVDDRRTLQMVWGFTILMLASLLANVLGFVLLSTVLEKLVLGSAVVMAIILQSEVRRLLEQLGKGQIWQLFTKNSSPPPKADSVIDEIVEAVRELSQNRTGALMILETDAPLDERDFKEGGVKLNAEISKELLQTIFQPKTLLHDGAVLIRGSRVVAAGVILPLSDRTTSRQLGTRHRAAMGMTEQVSNCLCVVVSEETGSISLAEKGNLNRPLTSSKLKELLSARFTPIVERDAIRSDLQTLGKTIRLKLSIMIKRTFKK